MKLIKTKLLFFCVLTSKLKSTNHLLHIALELGRIATFSKCSLCLMHYTYLSSHIQLESWSWSYSWYFVLF